jgi:hypothetical protein
VFVPRLLLPSKSQDLVRRERGTLKVHSSDHFGLTRVNRHEVEARGMLLAVPAEMMTLVSQSYFMRNGVRPFAKGRGKHALRESSASSETLAIG